SARSRRACRSTSGSPCRAAAVCAGSVTDARGRNGCSRASALLSDPEVQRPAWQWAPGRPLPAEVEARPPVQLTAQPHRVQVLETLQAPKVLRMPGPEVRAAQPAKTSRSAEARTRQRLRRDARRPQPDQERGARDGGRRTRVAVPVPTAYADRAPRAPDR